jgi:hypothetical protein
MIRLVFVPKLLMLEGLALNMGDVYRRKIAGGF